MPKHITPAHIFASIPRWHDCPLVLPLDVIIRSKERITQGELRDATEAAIAVMKARNLKRTADNLTESISEIRPDWTITILDERLDISVDPTTKEG